MKLINVVTNRGSVYVLIEGKTVEMEVDTPIKVPEDQAKRLISRGICMAVIDKPKTK